MSEFQIKAPQSLYVSKATKTSPNGEAIVMKNFIPTLGGGLQLRKGHKYLNFSKVDFIATYKNTNTLILFSQTNGLIILNKRYMVVYENKEFKDIPVYYIETNERLLLFFDTQFVKELSFVGEAYSIKEVLFNNNIPRVFAKAVRYRERLYFIEKDSNVLYYAGVLAYKGDLETFDVSNVFNSKGKVINIDILGYFSGSGVFSNLVVAFESGDILLFDGINPADPNNWQAVTKISTNLSIYKQSINYASNLYLLTSNGLLDIQASIQSNDVANATTLAIPIQEAINFNQSKIFTHKEYIVITQSYSKDVYFFDTRLKAWFCIAGYSFNYLETFNDNLVFSDTEGNLYEAFSDINDNGKPITGELATSWIDLGTANNKRITFINCGMFYSSGEYNIKTGIYTNDVSTKGITKQLPLVAPNFPRWKDITPTWEQTSKLWFGATLGAYKSIKFPKMGFGRNFSFYFLVESNYVDNFEFQNMSINFDMTKF